MTTKPNIVFIFADQLRSHAVGCYGNHQVKTPNMDRLATEGVRFTNAISTHPVCGPYRGMLMTGNFPMKNGVLYTDHFLRNPEPYFAEVCKTAGYQTGYVGKWHIDGVGREAYIPPERRLGFDYWRTLECTHNYFNSKYYHQDETEPRVWPEYDAISQTESACEFIEQQADDPFCLFLSWGPPHGPYDAPQEYMDRFPPAEITLRENVDDFETAEYLWSRSDTVLPEKYQSMRDGSQKELQDVSNATIRRRYQGYYAAIEALDDCMGTLLTTLEQAGKLDSTIVVFTSDHGDSLGSHRQDAKQLPFEESISIPLMIRYPSKVPAASVADGLFAPVDIMPTLLSLADVPCHDVDGTDLSAVVMGQTDGLQDAVLIQKSIALSTNWITNGNGPWNGVRTKRYTYARLANDQSPWLLYDNLTDPLQVTNLVNDPAHATLRDELNQLTSDLLTAAGESGDPSVYAEVIHQERNARGFSDRWPELNPERT